MLVMDETFETELRLEYFGNSAKIFIVERGPETLEFHSIKWISIKRRQNAHCKQERNFKIRIN